MKKVQHVESRSADAASAAAHGAGGGLGGPPLAPTAPLVLGLDAVGRHDLALVGGKGANLGELIHAGLPVPPGFCVTTAAYALVAERADLDPVFEALAEVPADDTGRLAALAEAARVKLLAVPVPDAIATAVIAAYQTLEGPRPVAVAVRSSATAEDLPTASFAGQQETYLNVVGVEALVEAVQRCWASLWTDRAVSYRAANGVDHRGVRLAAVVQQMIDAAAAGVMFTANPVTGARGEAVIDAGRGLGEAVVSGLVTPDRYVVTKRTLRVKEHRRGGGGVVIRALPGGGTEEVTADGHATAPVLSRDTVRALVRLGIAIERHYGVPQDVEWAWADGKLFALQARPITALPEPVKTGWLAERRAGMAAELFSIRPYPLDVSTHTSTGLSAVMEAMLAPLGVGVFPIDQAFVEEDGVVVRIGEVGPRPSLRMLYQPWLTLWRSRHIDVADWEHDPVLRELQGRARQLAQRDLRALDWQGLQDTLRDALTMMPLGVQIRRRYLPPALRDVALFALLLRLTGQHGKMNALLSGVETKTLELNRALEALAAQVRATPALRELFAEASIGTSAAASALLRDLESLPAAKPFLESFRAFLDRYGHRETVLGLASQSTWKAAPEVPLGLIKTLAADEPPPEPVGPAPWEQARDEVLARSALGRAPLRGWFLRLLPRARLFVQLREDTHFYYALSLPAVHRCFQEFGRRLAEEGVIDTPEDVLHVKAAELETPWPVPPATKQRLRELVARRKAKRAALGERMPNDPRVRAASGDAVGDAVLTGVPASPGVVEGPVRIIHGPSDFGALQSGDVLVARFTNPAWTPLFRRAAAIVVDTGSGMSHAAIVAREYGIPAVMGVMDATSRLRDGQRVRVDGVKGAVYEVSA